MKTIEINGKEYRVRLFKISRDVNWAANRACEKCCFARGGDCDLPDGQDCSKFNKRNRRGAETHYAYFQKVNQDSPWPDIAIGLVALAVAAVLGLLCSSCSSKPAAQEPTGPETGVTYERLYKDFGKSVEVDKVTYEGHDYLLFSGRTATTPFALHSESCPCKAKEGGK